MRKTGNYRPKPHYKDILGDKSFNIKEFKSVNISVEHDSGGTVLNLISNLSSENEVFTKYFEPEFQWADGTVQFESDIKNHDAWYIKYIDNDMGLVHQTRLSVAIESKTDRFFPTRKAAINFIHNSLRNEIL